MNRKSIVAIALVAVASGFGAGALSGALAMQHAMFSSTAERDAWETLERVEVLSRLRLGQTATALDLLESSLSEQVLFISAHIPPAAGTNDAVGYRALLAAKAYINVFPLSDSESKGVDEALREIPLEKNDDRYTDGVNQLMLRFRPKSPDTAVGT